MIYQALSFLQKEVQEFLELKIPQTQKKEWVSLSPLLDDQNKVAIPKESIGLSLIHIEEDTVNKSQSPQVQTLSTGKVAYQNPSIKLNLYMIFAANFSKYAESLKNISSVISFFQANSVFEAEQNPTMDPSLGRLVVDLYTLGVEEQNDIWGTIGFHYLPSAVYRVRLLVIDENQVTSRGALVEQGTVHRNS